MFQKFRLKLLSGASETIQEILEMAFEALEQPRGLNLGVLRP